MEWNAYRDAGRIPGTEPGAFDLKYGWNSNEWFDASRIVAHITCDGTSSKFCNPRVDDAHGWRHQDPGPAAARSDVSAGVGDPASRTRTPSTCCSRTSSTASRTASTGSLDPTTSTASAKCG